MRLISLIFVFPSNMVPCTKSVLKKESELKVNEVIKYLLSADIESLRSEGSCSETTPGHWSLESVLTIAAIRQERLHPLGQLPICQYLSGILDVGGRAVKEITKKIGLQTSAPSLFPSPPSCFFLCPLPTCPQRAGIFPPLFLGWSFHLNAHNVFPS